MNTQSQTLKQRSPLNRNFFGAMWHGAFLALGVSLTQPTTVISAFVAELTGSTLLVGGFSTVLTVASVLPQLFAARYIEPQPRKMPYLLTAIYLRVISWGLLAWFIYKIGAQQPVILAWILVGMLVVFYAGGGLGNIPYTDIIGKIIPKDRRGTFFGGKGMLAGPLSVGAAFAARAILAKVEYPNNYALLFGLAAAGLAVASIGFLIIKEPVVTSVNRTIQPWRNYWRQLHTASGHLKTLIIVQMLTGFSLMALPFYVVFARERLSAPPDAVGWYLMAQIVGGVVSNIVWARLVDRFGSQRMLFFCALTSTLTPLLAIALGYMGWIYLLPVFFLAGATMSGRGVGYQSALLDLAPPEERATYAGLNAVLTLPIAFFSLAAGWFLQSWSYTALFLIAALFIGAGAVVIYHWGKNIQAPLSIDV